MKNVPEFRERWQLYRELQRAADECANGKPDESVRAKMRIEPAANEHPASDRTQIEKARRHRRNTEDMLGVEHSHDERRERHQQDERIHDACEHYRQMRLVGVEPR